MHWCFVLMHGCALVGLCSGLHVISVVQSSSLTRVDDGSGSSCSSDSDSGVAAHIALVSL